MDKKKRVVIASSRPLEPQHTNNVDWKKCFLCESVLEGEKLICPAKNPIASLRNRGYQVIAKNLQDIREYDHFLPSGKKIDTLDDGSGILNTLLQNRGQWHKLCYNKYAPPRFEILKRSLQRKKEESDQDPGEPSIPSDLEDSNAPPVTRSASAAVNLKSQVCFICGKSSGKSRLHLCATEEIFQKIKAGAQKMEDHELLGRLITGGDLVALEAKYHKLCLTRFSNKLRDFETQTESLKTAESGQYVEKDWPMYEGLAFADLMEFIREEISEHNKNVVFQMGDIKKQYSARLAQLGGVRIESLPKVNSTRLRTKILTQFPELKEYVTNREYVLIHNDVKIAQSIVPEDQGEDALTFMRFIRKMRRIISETKTEFKGTFPENCEVNSIPPVLLATVNSLLYGSAVTTEAGATKPALSICQAIIFNFHERVPKGGIVRHKKTHEPPLPVYTALSIYGRSRDKVQIDHLHGKGLCVSSNRVTEVTSQLCKMVVARAHEEGVVCPAVLKNDVYTLCALDNLDHKPSSTTSEGEFHGTGISVFQIPSKEDHPTPRVFQTNFLDVAGPDSRGVPDLPDSYAVVPEYVLRDKQPPPTRPTSALAEQLRQSDSTRWLKEENWLNHVHKSLANLADKESDTLKNVSWGAFHAANEGEVTTDPAINALLPLFHDKSASPSMIKHGMDIARKITSHLNGVQIPVMALDQPLFALAKILQWNLPELYGEDQFVLLLGPLHIEQAFLKVLGQFMESSGWVGLVANSGINTAGCAEALLKVTHVTKSRHYHQVTSAVLYSLLIDAYNDDCVLKDVPLQDWAEQRAATSPTFKFWLTVLRLEVLLLAFLRSVRQGSFNDYRESLKSMIPWFFIFDHHNYARWLSVHIKDLHELEWKAPSTHEEFQHGKFVVRKGRKPFSSIGVDHAHEQNNAVVKSTGGAIGLTQDPSSLRRWTIGGPEIARLLAEFVGDHQEGQSETHHENYEAFQRQFVQKTSALKDSFCQHENPFTVTSKSLIALDTRNVASQDSVNTLYAVEKDGVKLYEDFVEKRFFLRTKSLYDPIKRASTRIFVTKKATKSNPAAALKLDIQLFSRLFIVATARDMDLNVFFEYENQVCPPSISVSGHVRPGSKADLVTILENLDRTKPAPPKTADGIVIDGAALVRFQKPRPDRATFREYFTHQLKPYLQGLASKYGSRRVDLAWDMYSDVSIKNRVRTARGTGMRRQDLPLKGKLPSNWDDYLRNSGNKEELFRFLSEHCLAGIDGADVVTNVNHTWKSSRQGVSSLEGLSCSAMEEADARIVTHANDMVLRGATSVLIICSDTDVLVIAASFYHDMVKAGLQELWILFGCGETRRYIAVHNIARELGEARSIGLRGFHAFTGCDSVSFFASKGKRSAWRTWDEAFTDAFLKLSHPCVTLDEDTLRSLEKFTTRLYGVQSTNSIDQARKILFATESKPLHLIPPTRAALVQHSLRAAYQAGHLWGQASTAAYLTPPSPASWGWQLSTDWTPFWSTNPPIWDACRTLDRCGCTKNCETMRCVCRRHSLPCTAACKVCQGDCSNKSERYHGTDVVDVDSCEAENVDDDFDEE